MSDNQIQAKAIEVWNATFKNGQEVVLEDDNGYFHWGRLKNYDWGIKLIRIGGHPILKLEWHEIVFIAQDGFPVQEIMGMSYDEAVFLCDCTPTEIIREKLLGLTNQKKEKKSTQSSSYTIAAEYTNFGGGCPFIFEDVQVKNLLYPGNNGPRYWGEDNEETLILQGRNGAIMHSFDMSHLFFFDGLEKQLNIPIREVAMSFNEKAW